MKDFKRNIKIKSCNVNTLLSVYTLIVNSSEIHLNLC